MLATPYKGPINPYAAPQKRLSPYALPGLRGGYGTHVPMTEPYQPSQQEADLLLPWDHSGQRNPDYLCLMFHGRRGRGKSTGATAFARYLRDINRAMDPDYRVYSNFKIDFADMCHPRLVDALITFPPWLRKCLVIVDEIAVYFPSVRATATGALNFSTFLQEIRKLEVDMIFTTQFPTMVIGQASIQIDLFIEPYLYNKVYERSVRSYIPNSMLLNCVDWWGQWTGYPVQHRWPPEPNDVIARPKLHNLRSIYRQFNTKEVIPAFWHPGRQNIIHREWQQEWEAEQAAAEARLEPLVERPRVRQRECQTLQELLDDQEEQTIRLSAILKEATKIDPQIKGKHANLAAAMRRLGWTCFQEGGRYGEWIGEKLRSQ